MKNSTIYTKQKAARIVIYLYVNPKNFANELTSKDRKMLPLSLNKLANMFNVPYAEVTYPTLGRMKLFGSTNINIS